MCECVGESVSKKKGKRSEFLMFLDEYVWTVLRRLTQAADAAWMMRPPAAEAGAAHPWQRASGLPSLPNAVWGLPKRRLREVEGLPKRRLRRAAAARGIVRPSV